MDKQILDLLKQMNEKLEQQSGILNEHGQQLNEHGHILGALKTGQESLKAELSALKLQNAKEFGEIKEQISSIEISVDMLKEESWNNRKDIRRIQQTMEMK